MRLKELLIFLLLASPLLSCVKHSETEIRIMKGKKHQAGNDCPQLDCGHTGKRK